MIPVYPNIINDTNYQLSSSERVRYSLWAYIYSLGLPDGLIKKAYYKDQVGKDSMCYWSELLFYYDLIEYLTLMFEQVTIEGYTCGSPEFIEKIKSYDLSCVKKTLLCRYGSSGVADGLKNKLVETLEKRVDLCCPPGEGISFMQILGNDCNVFHVYPQV